MAAEHPDLGGELTRKRHTVWPDMRQTLSPELIRVPVGFVVTAEELAKQKINEVKKESEQKPFKTHATGRTGGNRQGSGSR